MKSTTTWFFEEPYDLEYKRYKLLASVEYAEKTLEEGNIHDAMDFIEDHLVCFYRFQTDQEIRQVNDAEIIGIDPIMMDLIYKKTQVNKSESNEIKVLSDIAELGSLEFEALHSLFRIKWRAIDDSLESSYIPQKPDLITGGFVYLTSESDLWVRKFKFQNPSEINEWKHFDFKFLEEFEFDRDKLLNDIIDVRENNVENIVISSILKKPFNSKRAIDFVLTCKVYYKLQKDFLF